VFSCRLKMRDGILLAERIADDRATVPEALLPLVELLVECLADDGLINHGIALIIERFQPRLDLPPVGYVGYNPDRRPQEPR